MNNINDIKVLFAASEVVPFAKTGGLADVAGSLPKCLRKLGVDVRVVMPKYRSIPCEYVEKMEYLGYIYVDISWRHQYCGIFRLVHEGVVLYFIDNEYYFKREGLYGSPDEAEQFTFFSKAIIEMLPAIDFKPDIVHLNDWQTAIASTLLKTHYSNDSFYRSIKTILTIHNLKYQGVFPKSVLSDLLSLGWEHFTPYGLEFYDQVNFLKAGIVYSDIINTVSRTYAQEIKNDFFGEQLQDSILRRSNDLYGIVNGIDYENNNPATDKRIYANYDLAHIHNKYTNKEKLQETLGLPIRKDVPLIGIITRLVAQKGLDLIQFVLDDILSLDIQLVVLGSGEAVYEEMFKKSALTYPDKVSANITYDSILAQRIYAGSDMFLMPSLFEPCGLGQLFSLRYGSIPIVRETGGLNDTVDSYNQYTKTGNGFSFSNYNSHDMLYTIKRAIHFYHDKFAWDSLIKNAMTQDFSWDKSAGEYIDLYKKLLD